MSNIFIHPTAEVDQSASIGEGSKIWNQAQVRNDATIGENCIISKNAYIDEHVTIGNRVKIQNNVNVYHGVTVEDDVFLGPSMTFTNDMYPRAFSSDWEITETLVKKGASIGANATIRCGITIGEYATIGSGSVVTKDVKPYALMVGNPARQIGWVCKCGYKLGENGICPKCQQKYNFEGID
jgi:acetyltransferase-like isoleucine patch superfamily enzyme